MTAATQKPSDFVTVQLTADGAKFAPIRISNAHFSYFFKPGDKVRVLSSEWTKTLSRETWQGKQLFEIATEGAPGAAAPGSQQSPAKTPSAPAPAAETAQKGN